MQLRRLVGGAGGAAAAILALVAVTLAPGPFPVNGRTVIVYYSIHGTAILWQAVLVGLAFVWFLWFVETLTTWLSAGAGIVAGAAVTAALYLVAVGCWETLGEIYGGVSIAAVAPESYPAAHALYAAGAGAAHLANVAIASFTGLTSFALLASARSWRWLGRIGLGLAAVQLFNGPYQIFATSHGSVVVGEVVLLAWLAWVFAVSIKLVLSMRTAPGAVTLPREAASRPL